MEPLHLIVTAICAYALGSVPFGLILARAFGLGDIREIGSGNIGATNVLRSGSKPAAALTLALDAGKGAAAVLAARALAGETAASVAGLFAFLGHLYPAQLGFRGGKGVATYLGALLALSLPAGMAACATWLATAAVFRFSSLAALAAALLAPVFVDIFLHWVGAAVMAAMSALTILKHRANIKRLRAGTEPKIGARN